MSKYTDALKDAGKASLTLAVTGAEGARILLSATARIGAAALSDGMGELSKVTEEAAKKIPTKTNADSTTGEVLGTVSKVPFLSKLAVNTSKLSKDGSKITWRSSTASPSIRSEPSPGPQSSRTFSP